MDQILFDVQKASLSVEGRRLLADVSIRLDGSRLYGLIGHNGSGKSTLVKLLAGQLRPTAGAVLYRGRPVTEWDRRAFAREVAYLPQTPPAATGLTVRELVALGRYPWHGALGRFRPADRAKVDEAMELTEVGDLADRLVDTLSGGERQRAWIASLVAQGTSCLILDEPTSALDIGHQLQVLDLIGRLARQGMTVMVVLHDVNMAARFCDELVALRGGRLVERGPSAALMTEETLFGIYGVRMAVIPHPAGRYPLGIAL